MTWTLATDMPTYQRSEAFLKDYEVLDAADKERFRRTVQEEFIPDLEAGGFRPGLRVKRVQRARGVFEMTWAPDGRATFMYGPEQVPHQPQFIWRRVGTHSIFKSP
jgi:hypothetical protein